MTIPEAIIERICVIILVRELDHLRLLVVLLEVSCSVASYRTADTKIDAFADS